MKESRDKLIIAILIMQLFMQLAQFNQMRNIHTSIQNQFNNLKVITHQITGQTANLMKANVNYVKSILEVR